MSAPLLVVEGLSKRFPIRDGVLIPRETGAVRAVDDVSFSLDGGETLGVVGESGCGKSTLGRLVLRLIEPTAGAVRYDGVDFLALDGAPLRAMRRKLQIVFQDPQASLNPRMTVEDIILEPLYVQGERRGAASARRAAQLLDMVGLPARHASRYPHEFSGGQRQRIGIARAIAPNPRFIVCDEAVSALDVSVQAQIVNLLMDLQRDLKLSYLFIAHDLAVVKQISHRVAIMYLGRIVEIAPARAVYANPLHPYTRALLSAIPVSHPRQRRPRQRLRGDIPSPLAPPPGCSFHTRCPHADARCSAETPALRALAPGQDVACHHAERIARDMAAPSI